MKIPKTIVVKQKFSTSLNCALLLISLLFLLNIMYESKVRNVKVTILNIVANLILPS